MRIMMRTNQTLKLNELMIIFSYVAGLETLRTSSFLKAERGDNTPHLQTAFKIKKVSPLVRAECPKKQNPFNCELKGFKVFHPTKDLKLNDKANIQK
jgi:hypothetical protein